MPPLISIVSGTYNRLPYLQDMVASARANIPMGMTYEIILVDGGSTDGTIAWCEAQPDIRLIQHGALLGAIRAFTEGAYQARGRYVLLANDDILFTPHSIVRALIHLEDNPLCGAAAMPDDRPVQWKTDGAFGCQYMQATRNGVPTSVIYAQVGLYRRWLGDACNWWGYGQVDSRTYGGDNYLTARILEHGYTVDCVEGANIIDRIPADALRALNDTYADKGFHALYPHGVTLVDIPRIPSPDVQALRVLYLPIYENHTTQHQQKRGLRDALATYYMVYEVDYLNTEDAQERVKNICAVFKPHLILTQFHGADQHALLRTMRSICPRALFVNWNGDYWPHGLTTPAMLEMLKLVDLQLVVNADVLDTYTQHGIASAYWQIGYENPRDSELPEVESHDIVFLGNCYSEQRVQLGKFLRELPYRVGIYGTGWDENGIRADGECLYDFAKGRALYRSAKLAIGDNQFPDAKGFVSNRLFEAMSAGGALMLHQTIPGLYDLTGISQHDHYEWWIDFDYLKSLIDFYMGHEKERAALAQAGTDYVRKHHSFDARVKELVGLIETRAKRELGGQVLMVNDRLKIAGGVRGAVTNISYMYTPGQSLEVDAADADALLAMGQGWRRVK